MTNGRSFQKLFRNAVKTEDGNIWNLGRVATFYHPLGNLNCNSAFEKINDSQVLGGRTGACSLRETPYSVRTRPVKPPGYLRV